MTDDRPDRVDDWLSGPVPTMMPPPGTYEMIRKRARRRRQVRAAMTSALGVAVVAVAITIPRVIVPHLSPSQPAASATNSTSPSAHVTPTGKPVPGNSTPPPGAVAVLPHFRVSSVTFVDASQGWVLGQAGSPGQCTGPSPSICTSMARTSDRGQTWSSLPAPVAGAPEGASGVSQVRFLNSQEGWAFGPGLWATTDGGAGTGGTGWRQESLPLSNQRVTDLETVAGRAYALFALCAGSGRDFAAHCSSFSLYSTPAGKDGWTLVPQVTGLLSPAGTASSASLVLTGSRGYVLAPDGTLFSGPVTGTAGWGEVTSGGKAVTLPCAPGPAQASGQPSQAMLAASGSSLLLLCPGTPASGGAANVLYSSADGGATWQSQGSVPVTGTATSLSGTPAGGAVVATTSGIEVAASPSGTWHAATGASPRGGFSYVGMTELTQGVAIPADQRLDSLWFTYQSVQAWTRSSLPQAGS